jgi:predicted Zn-dependent protease
MQIQLFADELAEAAIPDILNVSRIISDVYGHQVTASYRSGMFRQFASGDTLKLSNFRAETPTIAVTGYDLQPSGLGFSFGLTQGHGSLVSTARLRGSTWRFMVVTLHEVGHLLGLVDRSCSNHDGRHHFEGHCRNICVMRPVSSLVDVDRCAEDIDQGYTILCNDCRAFLRTR